MRKYKKYLLIILLFTFTFFTFHDYVIEEFDTDTQYELCFSQNKNIAIDTQTQIHQYIHNIILDVLTPDTKIYTQSITAFEPSYTSQFMHERIEPVLYTPPIS
ncbi:hypothetical protein [Sulfurimonas sp.]|uniref:hypothetical protein n=1 Tax=Sulfurimonas sp. TaxID=2022749 RepID=UPI002639A7DB|nr:hypothetical protein [Sulfurimonas sp.]